MFTVTIDAERWRKAGLNFGPNGSALVVVTDSVSSDENYVVVENCRFHRDEYDITIVVNPS